ncbi:thioesterase II family protein [Kitasatospora sp. NPDC088346]|uniref:thioesterase II family protein n=1 Tax=Kitasatospora sp. NPDC088346 TaxID=3364073 RepID=UPI0037FD383B
MTAPLADSGLWCRCYHPSPSATRRLVCFPHAGGSAVFFHPVSAALAPGIEVLAIQYPGRQDRRLEPGIGDIGRLADEIARALDPWRGAPLDLFGHSMGALVAFEVALRLERDGHPPANLFVSGRKSPSLGSTDLMTLTESEIIADLRSLDGTGAGLLEDAEMLDMILQPVRNDYRAVGRYRSRPDAVLSCPVTALVGDDDPRAAVPETAAWEAHTTGAFELRVFPGGHFYLTARAAEVIALLRDRMTAGQGSPGPR